MQINLYTRFSNLNFVFKDLEQKKKAPSLGCKLIHGLTYYSIDKEMQLVAQFSPFTVVLLSVLFPAQAQSHIMLQKMAVITNYWRNESSFNVRVLTFKLGCSNHISTPTARSTGT